MPRGAPRRPATNTQAQRDVAYSYPQRLAAALSGRDRRETCIVYDADGKRIATIDPVTRKRTAVP